MFRLRSCPWAMMELNQAHFSAARQMYCTSPLTAVIPVGVTASASKRHEYLRWSGEKERYIVEVDFEPEFSLSQKSEETLFSHTKFDNVIYMNSFSITVSPSLRIGYMILPKHLVSAFHHWLGFYACTVPTYIQYVMTELLANGDFERHINRFRRAKRREINQIK